MKKMMTGEVAMNSDAGGGGGGGSVDEREELWCRWGIEEL